eukprot:TRINITY_DN2324_c0_g1_i3.p1 TRINITY_DN2324_c0_g1~~TRINITY_DN2324_c0_g1_i3.p1  ORF type:complete len:330 (-),score=38.72 TRINITY_DN2324_c0_g1_i3:87-1076(-)
MSSVRSCPYCAREFPATALRQTVHHHKIYCAANPDRHVIRCDVCQNVLLKDLTSLRRHLQSRRHKRARGGNELDEGERHGRLKPAKKQKHHQQQHLQPSAAVIVSRPPSSEADHETTTSEDEEEHQHEQQSGSMPSGRFDVIVADPPWPYHRNQCSGAAENHYPTMTREQLLVLPVQGLAARNCALLLWTTGPHLDLAQQLIEAWGFEYKTVFFTWIKVTERGTPVCGLGTYTRSASEFCLLATRGTVMHLKKSHSVLQVISAERREHSRKPEESRNRIEGFFGTPHGDGTRIVELFARQGREGWASWGNEVDKFAIDAQAVTGADQEG